MTSINYWDSKAIIRFEPPNESCEISEMHFQMVPNCSASPYGRANSFVRHNCTFLLVLYQVARVGIELGAAVESTRGRSFLTPTRSSLPNERMIREQQYGVPCGVQNMKYLNEQSTRKLRTMIWARGAHRGCLLYGVQAHGNIDPSRRLV